MISVVIASRGRPELLAQTIEKLQANAVLPDTVIAVALDDDDETMKGFVPSRGVHVSVAAREDSIGSKYNRAAALCLADLYLLWADDMAIPTPEWDKKLQYAADQFTDGYGVLYFGKVDGVFQPGIAVTHKFMDAMGFFNPPWFYFWWADTWVDEVARLSDKILYVDVAVELLQPIKGNSRNVKEITFWAEFFDRTRPMRRLSAEKIIDQSKTPPWRTVQLRQRMPQLEQILAHRNSKLRDPAQAAQLEAHFAFDNENSERYERVKAAAVKMLEGVK